MFEGFNCGSFRWYLIRFWERNLQRIFFLMAKKFANGATAESCGFTCAVGMITLKSCMVHVDHNGFKPLIAEYSVYQQSRGRTNTVTFFLVSRQLKAFLTFRRDPWQLLWFKGKPPTSVAFFVSLLTQLAAKMIQDASVQESSLRNWSQHITAVLCHQATMFSSFFPSLGV